MLANVNDVMNAVMIKGDALGPMLMWGAGAGADPTASSVVGDLVDVVRALTVDPDNRVPHLAFQPDALAVTPVFSMAQIESAYYLRFRAVDKPGVLADASRILGEHQLSIEAIRQQEPSTRANTIPIVIVTHPVAERAIDEAIAGITALSDIEGPITRIRMATFE